MSILDYYLIILLKIYFEMKKILFTFVAVAGLMSCGQKSYEVTEPVVEDSVLIDTISFEPVADTLTVVVDSLVD